MGIIKNRVDLGMSTMGIKTKTLLIALTVIAMTSVSIQAFSAVRLKELVRVEGVRDNPLLGYGIVVGLAGSGDSARSKATLHSISMRCNNLVWLLMRIKYEVEMLLPSW